MIPSAKELRVIGKEMAIVNAIANAIRKDGGNNYILATANWLDVSLRLHLVDLGYFVEKVEGGDYKISW